LKKWTDEDDWDLWFYIHHANFSHSKTAEIMGSTQKAVIGRYSRKGLALHPPVSRVPEKYKKYIR